MPIELDVRKFFAYLRSLLCWCFMLDRLSRQPWLQNTWSVNCEFIVTYDVTNDVTSLFVLVADLLMKALLVGYSVWRHEWRQKVYFLLMRGLYVANFVLRHEWRHKSLVCWWGRGGRGRGRVYRASCAAGCSLWFREQAVRDPGLKVCSCNHNLHSPVVRSVSSFLVCSSVFLVEISVSSMMTSLVASSVLWAEPQDKGYGSRSKRCETQVSTFAHAIVSFIPQLSFRISCEDSCFVDGGWLYWLWILDFDIVNFGLVLQRMSLA